MTRRERGLGLLELIVALMLVTLASTLVMQGIGQGLGMLRRVANDQGVAYHELMARAWLRESIAAAAAQAATVNSDGAEQEEGDAEPARPAEPPRPVFAGSAATLEMQSFRPLLGAEGVATPLSAIDKSDHLCGCSFTDTRYQAISSLLTNGSACELAGILRLHRPNLHDV